MRWPGQWTLGVTEMVSSVHIQLRCCSIACWLIHYGVRLHAFRGSAAAPHIVAADVTFPQYCEMFVCSWRTTNAIGVGGGYWTRLANESMTSSQCCEVDLRQHHQLSMRLAPIATEWWVSCSWMRISSVAPGIWREKQSWRLLEMHGVSLRFSGNTQDVIRSFSMPW